MARHLREEALLGAARGDEDEGARAHLEGCGACRERVVQGKEGLDLASLASDVPEPSPLFWDSFRREVSQRIAADGEASGAARSWRRFGLALLVPLATAAALLIAIIPAVRHNLGAAPGPGSVLPAWEALPASADDGALDVLRGLALQGTDLQAATECQSVVDCLGEMNDEESQDLADALRGELPEGRS